MQGATIKKEDYLFIYLTPEKIADYIGSNTSVEQ
jgi:hypothetical protein